MVAKNTRRAGVIAGLALMPALVFGGSAVAASVDGHTAQSDPSQTQPVNPSDGQHKKIKVHGQVSKIEKRADVVWGEVTVVSVVAHPGGPELDFVLAPDTTVDHEDGAPQVGDKVTASGEIQDGKTVRADHVVFH